MSENMTADKRARPRLKVTIPVQVIGQSIEGEKFREISQTLDASAFGLGFILQTFVQKGTVLYLSLRLPRRLRLFDLAKDIYQVYAQVQRVQLLAQGGYEIGVAFIGRNAPNGFENFDSPEYASLALSISNTPTAINQTTGAFVVPVTPPSVNAIKSPPPPPTIKSSAATDIASPPPLSTPEREVSSPLTVNQESNKQNMPPPPPMEKPLSSTPPANVSGAEARRDERHAIPIDVVVEYLDDRGNTTFQEPGLVTNISRSGACVMSTQESRIGNHIKITMMRDNFISKAVVKAVSLGQGGIWNLHIQFIDKSWTGGT